MTRLPKPAARPDKVSFRRYLKMFSRDVLSAQPARLYRAWMAEFRTPFFRSYLVNQTDIVRKVLADNDRFPKSDRVSEGLRPLLGNSVFVTNGEVWKRQRRIIDPAFEGGRLRDTFPAMWEAGLSALDRMGREAAEGPVEVEELTSHAAADVIFRTLFSIPISHATAAEVFVRFRDYQRSQPLMNLGAFFRIPDWMPRLHHRGTRKAGAAIRRLIEKLTAERMAAIRAGTAPDDLATKIMTTADPLTGETFDTAEMVDQVAIFFLAGHETSASALAWSLYALAQHPEAQDRVAEEAARILDMENPAFSAAARLAFTRDVFREVLRLYPPVPMMIRENTCPERFRDRDISPGGQIIVSPWYIQRHERIWDRPDDFDPDRFRTEEGRRCMRDAWLPFSEGPRVCTGAGFAMVEGPLLLAMLVRAFRFEPVEGAVPVPVALLTLRSRDGIRLKVTPRETAGAGCP